MAMRDAKIQMLDGMVVHVITNGEQTELIRNAMLLCPYISNMKIRMEKLLKS